MKTQKKFYATLIVALVAAVIMLYACKKEEVANLPDVTTLPVTQITKNSALCQGNISHDGGGEINRRGVVWSTTANPTIETNDGITQDGSGIGHFTSNLTGLSGNTEYYVRAYATNSAGTAYGGQEYFITDFIFDGVFLVAYEGADPDPEWAPMITPYDIDAMWIKLDGIWLETDEFILQVNFDETIVDPFIGSSEDYEGQFIGLLDETYGRVRFEDVNGGLILDASNGEFEFYATPTLPDSGYWWGGEKHFRLVPTGDGGMKLTIVGETKGLKAKPVKR